MTDASYWHAVCGTRCTAGFPSLVADPWCRRMLSEAAAAAPIRVGRDGYQWLFADGSALIANSEISIVR